MPPRIATHVRSAGSSEAQDSGDEASEAAGAADGAGGTPVSGSTPAKFGAPEMDALHFFGVFDGHGARPAGMVLSPDVSWGARLLSRVDHFAMRSQCTAPVGIFIVPLQRRVAWSIRGCCSTGFIVE